MTERTGLFSDRATAPDTDTPTSAHDESSESGSAGLVVLAPIEGSIERAALRLELELSRADGVLVLGDLRAAAEGQSQAGHHEAAHRLWAFVHTAASRVGLDALVARAIAMGDGALLKLRADARINRRRSSSNPTHKEQRAQRGVSYDYLSLAADCESGMTQRETAAKWDCSTTTVSRAVRYVAARAALLESSPDLKSQIHAGKSVNELSAKYDLETKVMRWIVSDYWDRRT